MKEFFDKYKKEIIITLIVLIVFFIIRKNWWKISKFFQPPNVDLQPDESLSEGRMRELEILAEDLKKDIYSTPITGHNYSLYASADALRDTELIYLAQYYKNNLTEGNSLYSDIESQWYTWGDEASELQSHLSKIGEI